MSEENGKNFVERRLYITMIELAAVILLCSLGVTMALDISRERRELDGRIRNTAAYIASLECVKTMLNTGYPDVELSESLEALTENFDGVDAILIADINGLRFYHTSRLTAEDTYVDGDEQAALAGAAPYITTVYGTRGLQRCAFHGVADAEGDALGFVMSSVAVSRLSAQRGKILLVYVSLFVLMLLLSAVLAETFLRFQQNALMGYQPGELLNLYIRQDEIINSISEGLISADRSGIILFSNYEARKIIAGDGDDALLTGKRLKEVFPETHFDEVIAGTGAVNRVCVIGNRTVVVNEVPIRARGKAPRGMLVILQDRTEALRLSDELSGARAVMDTLRAFNHEFLNKLHIILGYLQTGEIERARCFIINSSLVSSQAVRNAADAIRVSEVCALLIGKMMHAAEEGIRLILLPGSKMLERDLLIPVSEYVTVIGNLLENAIEELSEGNCEVREISLGIYCRPGVNIISCEDTGRGIPEELREHIFEKGVSAKGENHGTGLYLVKQIAERYQGELLVETEAGEGSCFTLTWTEERSEECRAEADKISGERGTDVPDCDCRR